MGSVRVQKENDIIKRNDFLIPKHWIQAARLAKQVLKKFKEEVSFNTFLSWNSYDKFEHFIARKIPVYITIRHTRHWLAQSLTYPKQSGYIKINIDDSSFQDKNNEVSESLLLKVLESTLIHELIHYFQDTLKLEEQLAPREKKKLELSGNTFNTNRNSFLYATNWVEMDAELGTYFNLHKFQVPTVQELADYFYEWYQDAGLALAIGTYIYDYFIGGRKKLELREKIFHRKIDIEDFIRA